MSVAISFIIAIAVLVVVGAMVVAFAGTDAGEACCSGAALILSLAAIGAMALFLLAIVALFGATCTALL